jgi:hypothetical protein
MAKLLRNRTLSIMIAILAFMAYALAPQMLCEMQASPAKAMQMAAEMPACHGAHATAGEPLHHGGGTHACCKLCVCHPAVTALPTTLALQPVLNAGKPVLQRAVSAAAPARIFTNKSSPRGPPLHL